MNKAAKVLLLVGLIGAILTGLSDMLLGYVRVPINDNYIAQFISGSVYLPTVRIGYGAVLGCVGILMQGLGLYAIHILMLEKGEIVAIFNKFAIIAYSIFSGIMHLGYATTLFLYKSAFELRPEHAMDLAKEYVSYFLEPIAMLTIVFFIILVLTQFIAIVQKKTIIPAHVAIYGNVVVGLIIALLISVLLPKYLEVWNGVTTSCLSIANIWMFLVTFLAIQFQSTKKHKKMKRAPELEEE